MKLYNWVCVSLFLFAFGGCKKNIPIQPDASFSALNQHQETGTRETKKDHLVLKKKKINPLNKTMLQNMIELVQEGLIDCKDHDCDAIGAVNFTINFINENGEMSEGLKSADLNYIWDIVNQNNTTVQDICQVEVSYQKQINSKVEISSELEVLNQKIIPKIEKGSEVKYQYAITSQHLKKLIQKESLSQDLKSVEEDSNKLIESKRESFEEYNKNFTKSESPENARQRFFSYLLIKEMLSKAKLSYSIKEVTFDPQKIEEAEVKQKNKISAKVSLSEIFTFTK